MPPTTTMFRAAAAARPALRQTLYSGAQVRAAFARTTPRFQQRSQFRDGGRRFQSTTAEAGAQQSWFKRMWESPIGLKTVHFWAPVMKWALVLAGVADFARPAEKLSLTQNAALTATGLIWTRWCLIIKPKNYLLAAVNFFLGIVGVVQVSRILMWQNSQKGLEATVKDAAQDVKESAKDIKKSVEDKVHS